MLAICPVCDELAPIKPTGIPIGSPGACTSACWQEVQPHPDARLTQTTPSGVVVETGCRGVGRRV